MADISDRKRQHLELAMDTASQSKQTAGWEDVHLVASSLPTVDPDEVDVSIDLCGVRLSAPFVIASMTGGHDHAIDLNRRLASAAQQLGIAIGSGSQRAALRDPTLAHTYTVIREAAPDAVVMANLGICQMVGQGDEPALSRDEVETAIGMLDAQFLIVHLNIVEELIQPEGDSNFVGLLDALEKTVANSSVPVIAKETGAGMSREIAGQLIAAGVQMIDVGGAGGTSFARIEGQRAARSGDSRGARLGRAFAGWGISTAASVLETSGRGVPVIATGGVRSGLDAAKALSLGATAIGLGRPMLEAAMRDETSAFEEMAGFIDELRVAMLLSGCARGDDLRSHQPVITGNTHAWATQRGLM